MRRRVFPTGYPLPGTRGFTLSEIVVALTLLAWGALAVVAATAAAVRAVASAESQIAATTAARGRVEHLASLPCSDLREGSLADTARGIHEWWTVTRSRNGVRLASDSVEYSERGAMRTLVVRRLILC